MIDYQKLRKCFKSDGEFDTYLKKRDKGLERMKIIKIVGWTIVIIAIVIGYGGMILTG